MPTFQGLVTEEQLLQLIAYVQVAQPSRVRSTRRPKARNSADASAAGRRQD